MEAIVLAGGLGTRLRKIVPNICKPMAPIAGHPFLEIVLTALAKHGFKKIVLSLGYMADKVVMHFGGQYKGMQLVYEIEETPLGTGGAIRAAISRCKNDHVFIFNGDTFIDLEVSQIEALWIKNRLPIIVTREVLDTSRYGRLIVQNGCIKRFTEKGVPGPGLINAGCYVLPRHCLDTFEVFKPFSLESKFLVSLISRTEVNAFQTYGQFIDIGIPEDYLRAQTELVKYFP